MRIHHYVAHLVCELKRKLVGPFLGDGSLNKENMWLFPVVQIRLRRPQRNNDWEIERRRSVEHANFYRTNIGGNRQKHRSDVGGNGRIENGNSSGASVDFSGQIQPDRLLYGG